LQAFRHKSLGLLAGLGRRSAVAEIGGLRFSGFLAWWLWRTIYWLKMPGFERKVRIALDWVLDLFFPRDIVYLRPLHAIGGQPARRDAPPHDSDLCSCNGPLNHEHPSMAITGTPRSRPEEWPAVALDRSRDQRPLVSSLSPK
jgi:hypothetical protein